MVLFEIAQLANASSIAWSLRMRTVSGCLGSSNLVVALLAHAFGVELQCSVRAICDSLTTNFWFLLLVFLWDLTVGHILLASSLQTKLCLVRLWDIILVVVVADVVLALLSHKLLNLTKFYILITSLNLIHLIIVSYFILLRWTCCFFPKELDRVPIVLGNVLYVFPSNYNIRYIRLTILFQGMDRG